MDSDWKGDLFTKSLDNRERFIGGSIIAYDRISFDIKVERDEVRVTVATATFCLD